MATAAAVVAKVLLTVQDPACMLGDATTVS